jgi:hypothetical protein
MMTPHGTLTKLPHGQAGRRGWQRDGSGHAGTSQSCRQRTSTILLPLLLTHNRRPRIDRLLRVQEVLELYTLVDNSNSRAKTPSARLYMAGYYRLAIADIAFGIAASSTAPAPDHPSLYFFGVKTESTVFRIGLKRSVMAFNVAARPLRRPDEVM